MGRTVSKNVTGIDGISAVLQGLPKEMRANILAQATDYAVDPMVDAMKRHARKSVRTGALYASIGKKTKKYPETPTAVTMVGPQRGYYKRGGRKVGAGESRQGSESPSHYAHLVEFGHAVRQPKKGTSIRKGTAKKAQAGKLQWVAPRPFARPGFQQTQAIVARRLVEGIGNGVEKTRAKLVREGAHAA